MELVTPESNNNQEVGRQMEIHFAVNIPKVIPGASILFMERGLLCIYYFLIQRCRCVANRQISKLFVACRRCDSIWISADYGSFSRTTTRSEVHDSVKNVCLFEVFNPCSVHEYYWYLTTAYTEDCNWEMHNKHPKYKSFMAQALRKLEMNLT